VEPPESADPRSLAPEVRGQLRSLSKVTADRVARHLVAAGELLDTDPEAALEHARAARAFGARIAAVREAAGLAAYRAGEWAEALSELRTARRLTGDNSYLPVIADVERALGRPERALALARSAEVGSLSPDMRAEMRIVESGVRRDLGQPQAALAALRGPDLDRGVIRPWSVRLWYAYADVLLAVGRTDEARQWFLATAALDEEEATDATERLAEIDGIDITEDWDDENDVTDEGAAGPIREAESRVEADGAARAGHSDTPDPDVVGADTVAPRGEAGP